MSLSSLGRCFFILTFCIGFAPVMAGEAKLYVAPFIYNSELTGHGRAAGGVSGTDFDLEDTLGVDPEESIRGVEAFVRFLGNRFAFSQSSGDYSGRETLSEAFEFNGTTFSLSESLETDLEVNRYKFLYGYDFSLPKVNVGFVVGAHVIDIEARVRSATGVFEEEDLKIAVPVIGATLGIHPIDKVAIHAEVTGFSATIAGVDATLIDGFVGIDYYFLPKFGLTVGYRYFNLDATDEDEGDTIDFLQQGVYFGLALHI